MPGGTQKQNERVLPDYPAVWRVAIASGETLCLPAGTHQLRVLSGEVWATFAGKDWHLQSGDMLAFNARRDAVVVSALGDAPVVMEMEGANAWSKSVKMPRWKNWLRRFAVRQKRAWSAWTPSG